MGLNAEIPIPIEIPVWGWILKNRKIVICGVVIYVLVKNWGIVDWILKSQSEPPPSAQDSGGDDYPVNPDDWPLPEGWKETSAGEKTGGRHRQWEGPNGEWRRWDKEGRPGGKERDPHWHDSNKPGEHIPPNG